MIDSGILITQESGRLQTEATEATIVQKDPLEADNLRRVQHRRRIDCIRLVEE